MFSSRSCHLHFSRWRWLCSILSFANVFVDCARTNIFILFLFRFRSQFVFIRLRSFSFVYKWPCSVHIQTRISFRIRAANRHVTWYATLNSFHFVFVRIYKKIFFWHFFCCFISSFRCTIFEHKINAEMKLFPWKRAEEGDAEKRNRRRDKRDGNLWVEKIHCSWGWKIPLRNYEYYVRVMFCHFLSQCSPLFVAKPASWVCLWTYDRVHVKESTLASLKSIRLLRNVSSSNCKEKHLMLFYFSHHSSSRHQMKICAIVNWKWTGKWNKVIPAVANFSSKIHRNFHDLCIHCKSKNFQDFQITVAYTSLTLGIFKVFTIFALSENNKFAKEHSSYCQWFILNLILLYLSLCTAYSRYTILYSFRAKISSISFWIRANLLKTAQI